MKSLYRPLTRIAVQVFFGMAFIGMQSSFAATTSMTSANHRVNLENVANKVGDTYYIRGDRNSNTTMRVDYKGIMNVSRDYTLAGVSLIFFEPGVKVFGAGSHVVGSLRSGSGNTPEGVVNLSLDFRAACGKKGALVSMVELRRKSDGSYVNLSQGSQPVPFSGGLIPAVIDCGVPQISQIADRSPASFNNLCWDTTQGRATELALQIDDDGGLLSVELLSSNRSLAVSPRKLTTNSIQKVAGKENRFKALFNITDNSPSPAANVKLTAKVTDLANHTKTFDYNINLPGHGENALQVNLSPVKSPVFVGQNASYGGTVQTRSCAYSRNANRHIQWMIDKLAGKTSTQIVQTRNGRPFKLTGPRTPFIAAFSETDPGFYRLRLLDVENNAVIYTASNLVEILPKVKTPVVQAPPRTAGGVSLPQVTKTLGTSGTGSSGSSLKPAPVSTVKQLQPQKKILPGVQLKPLEK